MNVSAVETSAQRVWELAEVERSAYEAEHTTDDSLRADSVALCHGFGDASGGVSVTGLVDLAEADPITGIPRMSAIPVTVQRVALAADAPACATTHAAAHADVAPTACER